ncbi:MAG: hypothetical protein ABEI99_01295, partial [Halobaculum sp.]
LPSLLGTGDPYYLTVEPAASDGPAYNLTAEGGDDLTRRRFEYFFSALASDSNRSKPYQRGRFGIKEAFTHSPFDELDSFRSFAPPNATDGDAVFVRFEGTRYRVAVSRA